MYVLSCEPRATARVFSKLLRIRVQPCTCNHTTTSFLAHSPVSQLFSVSANAAPGVSALVKAMDSDIKTVDLSLTADPCTVACLLRQWVVELPEPLLTFGLYESFLESFRSETVKEAMGQVVVQLPYANWLTAKRLLHFLSSLLDKDPSGLQTLAINFGPALLRPRKSLGGSVTGSALRGLLQDLPLICDVAEVVISNARELFDTYPVAEAAKVWESVGDGPVVVGERGEAKNGSAAADAE